MTKTTTEWFAVDRHGLAQLLERRGRSFAVLELISNSWDQQSTRVDVSLTKVEGRKQAYELVVEDDDPHGFSDLSHAFTLFAPSGKKGEAEKRGRFNLGEKLVIALCEEVSIASTKGTVLFGKDGRQQVSGKRAVGSEFRAVLTLSAQDMKETEAIIRTLIPPIDTFYNGELLARRDPAHDFKATLPTEISDEEGNLRPSSRKTVITLYTPNPGEQPMIYEMGIPIVENGDRWHYDIGQKVPLNMDRDNVKPAYLRQVRTLVANEMHSHITTEDANSTWVREALADTRITPEAVKSIVEAKFGEKVVAYDPSDPEANHVATSQGYTVVHGRSLGKDEWTNIRNAGAILPAGRVTPSETKLFQNQLSGGEGSDKLEETATEKWTEGMVKMEQYTGELGRLLLGYRPQVAFVSDVTLRALAFFGGGKLTFNVGTLGHRWFNEPDQRSVDALLIHEFAHHKVSNHLDHAFHDECCRLGAAMRGIQITL